MAKSARPKWFSRPGSAIRVWRRFFGLNAPVRPLKGQILVTERAQRVLAMPTTMRRAVTLALHPHQPEISARGAIGDIPLIEERGAEPLAGETIGDRRADQPAADYDRIVTLHPVLYKSRPPRS
jgi:hypothetical protein